MRGLNFTDILKNSFDSLRGVANGTEEYMRGS